MLRAFIININIIFGAYNDECFNGGICEQIQDNEERNNRPHQKELNVMAFVSCLRVLLYDLQARFQGHGETSIGA